MLDRAREALRSGNAASARRILDAYDTTFPRGQLRSAAGVVRTPVRCALGSEEEYDDCAQTMTDPGGGGEP